MYKIIGLLLIINAVILTAWWVSGENSYKGWVFSICLVTVFLGAFLFLSDRITEFNIEGIGSLKAATEQAIADASAIAELKERVVSQSATVDLIAREAAEAKALVYDLAEKNSIAEQKLAQLDKSINEGNTAVNNLQRYTNFNSTVLAAQNDDRNAYNLLLAWSKDDSFPFQKQSRQAAQTIMDNHHPAGYRSGFKVPWQEGIDPKKLSLDEISAGFKSQPPHIRIATLEFIWRKRTDLAKKDQLQFLVSVIRDDDSLQVVEYAGRFFGEGTDTNYKPLAIEAYLEWWKKNKDSIE